MTKSNPVSRVVPSQQQKYNLTRMTHPDGASGYRVLTLMDLLRILYTARWVIIVFVIVSLVGAGIYIKKAPKVYTSTARIYIENNTPKMPFELSGLKDAKNYLFTQGEMFKSTSILEEAITLYSEKAKKDESLEPLSKEENPIRYLKQGLAVSVGRSDDIIKVSFTSKNPDESAVIVNALVEAFIRYHAKQKKTTSAELLKILTKEKETRDTELMQKLQQMTTFKKENPHLVFDTEKGNIIIERLGHLSKAVTDAQLETLEAKAAYESAKHMLTNPASLRNYVDSQRSKHFQVATADDAAVLKSELNKLSLQLDSLKLEVTSEHPSIKAMEQKMHQIQEQIRQLDQEFAESQLATVEQEYLVMQEKEQKIRDYFKEQQELAVEYNSKYAQFAMLESDWEQCKKISDTLGEQIKKLDITDETGGLNINVLEYASPSFVPNRPPSSMILAIAVFAGCAFGYGSVLAMTYLDPRLCGDDEVLSIMKVPILGIIPELGKKNSKHKQDHLELQSDSVFAEACKRIGAGVMFGPNNLDAKKILITSAQEGDGKTTMAGHLAVVLAQSGQKTLLIDTDFKKPMLRKLFDIHEGKDLKSIIQGQASVREAVTQTSVRNLHLLHGGSGVVNSAELLNSERFYKVMKMLEQHYDRIILDSAPIISVTDTQILAAMSDFTILALNAKKSTRKLCEKVCRELNNVEANIMGVVVNKVSPEKGKYSYYEPYEKQKVQKGMNQVSSGPGNYLKMIGSIAAK